MTYSKYDMIEFDDNTEYMVIDTLNKNYNTYVLLINPDDEKDSFIVKEEKDEKGTYLTRLPKGTEYDLVAMEILKNNKEEVNKLLEGLEGNA